MIHKRESFVDNTNLLMDRCVDINLDQNVRLNAIIVVYLIVLQVKNIVI